LCETSGIEEDVMARLLSVNVGLPRDITWQGKIVHTAVWKSPVEGTRIVRRLNIDGDGQGDLHGHGGEHRAVFVYQIESYRYWQKELGRDDFTYGQFGENFTVDGLADADVCIGDRYRIGTALFEVTQPRVTCYRVGIRMDEPRLPALLVSHHRPGFYFRVLEEGSVEAGDEIVQVAKGPERMTVAEVDALLYLPGHARGPLERVLRIPALSGGWRKSFAALLSQDEAATGNAGLAAAAEPPAWAGFRRLRVTDKTRESRSVTSLTLEAEDGRPLAAARPGQFVVLRLAPGNATATLTRSYSLSGEPSERRYRISVKRNPGGAAGAFIDERVGVGDVLDVSAPRGSFTLRTGNSPVVLLSAGVGATPVVAMLQALAAESSPREIWWVHGAHDGSEHPFAAEVRTLLASLVNSHAHIRYSLPAAGDRPGVDFDAPGRLDVDVLRDLDVPRNADFFICGPSAFMDGLTRGLRAWGVAPDHIHTEMFGVAPSKNPGVVNPSQRLPHQPDGASGTGPLVSFARSGLNVRWGGSFQSLLELAEACDVPVRWACRTGVCHSCESGLVAGAVSYRPDPIDQPAAGNLLICCAQPRDDVVIDL
jgi:ferredoxin-NADP reductase/MOSC domain-containing protein YiiM